VAVTCCVILFGGLIAFAYRQGAHTTANATTPLLQADNTPYKEKPQDPGGMDVPFQDAVVFDQLDNAQTAMTNGEKIENLLPPPEQPIDEAAKVADATTTTPATESEAKATETAPPSAPKDNAENKGIMVENEKTGVDAADSVAAKIAATEEAMKTKATEAKTATTVTAKTKTETAKTAETETLTAVTPAKTVEPAVTKTAKTIPTKATTLTSTTATATATKMNAVAPAAPTPAPASTGGSAKVQLGAFKDESAARAAWAQFQKSYAPYLNGITPNYARADLGAKGVFYRVQGVNLSQAQAQSVCKSINAMKPGSCLIPQ
jgi:hypothetical protein